MAGICGILSTRALDPSWKGKLENMSRALSRASNTEDGIVELEDAQGTVNGLIAYRHFQHFAEQRANSRGWQAHASGVEGLFYGRVFDDGFVRGDSEAQYLMSLWAQKSWNFADDLNGKFSSVLRVQPQQWVLSHDRFGQETLFYTQRGELLIFGTNIRSILASGLVEAKPHYASLWHGLSFPCTPQPYTSFEGIYALTKGHHLLWEQGQLSTRAFHRLPYCEKDRGPSRKEYAEAIEEGLNRAVRRQIEGTVNAGSLLSGGVDSTFYTALGKKHSPDLRAVTLTLEGERFKAADESGIAGINAQMHGVPHQVVYRKPEDILSQWDDVIDNFEQPGSTFNTYYFAGQAAREAGFRNVLTGMGADELFGGFGYFRYIRMWRKYLWGAPLWKRIPKGKIKKLDSFSEMFEAREMIDFYTHNFVVMKEREKCLIWPKSGFDTFAHIRELYPEATAPCDDVDVMLYLMTANTPHEQMYRMGQSLKDHGVFGLHPFMDNDLVDLAMRIPADYKVIGHDRKVVLKDAARPWVSPEAVGINKLGFSFPMGYWLEHELQETAVELIASLVSRGFLDASAIQALRRKNDALFPKKTYKLLFLEKWFQRFIDA